MSSALPFAEIAARVPGAEVRDSDNKQPWLLLPADRLLAACTTLRDDPALAFDAVMDVTGYDLLKFPATPPCDDIAVVYLLRSMRHRHLLTLKVLAPRAACRVPSVAGLWPAAIYFEREVFDLLGVEFTGHPDLRRIMCPDDWIGHPLRKDYVYPETYNGVPHLREGQHFEEAPARGAAPAAGA